MKAGDIVKVTTTSTCSRNGQTKDLHMGDVFTVKACTDEHLFIEINSQLWTANKSDFSYVIKMTKRLFKANANFTSYLFSFADMHKHSLTVPALINAGEYLSEVAIVNNKLYLQRKDESIVQVDDSQTNYLTPTNRCYIASGWFNPEWLQEVEDIKAVLDKAGLDYFSPKDYAICEEDAGLDTQSAIYNGNIENLTTCNWMIANTRAKDQGTHIEAGRFSGQGKDIVYFCAGLPAGAQFNLMLAQSGVKVCTSIDELADYLTRSAAEGSLINEPYQGKIQ